MLLWFVVAFRIIFVRTGMYPATRVHNTKDFAIAGRHLPLCMVTAKVFSTWFGSETVLGIPATFLKEGLRGVVAHPLPQEPEHGESHHLAASCAGHVTEPPHHHPPHTPA
jgi:Na+/proline symporter